MYKFIFDVRGTFGTEDLKGIKLKYNSTKIDEIVFEKPYLYTRFRCLISK